MSRQRRGAWDRGRAILAAAALALACASAAAGAQVDGGGPAAVNAGWWARLGLDRVGLPTPGQVVVGIVDTAIDLQHEDFDGIAKQALVALPRGAEGGCASDDCCPTVAPSRPERFHGTAVAGLITAARGNGRGIDGIGRAGSLISIDVFSSDMAPGTRVAAGIDCALSRGAKLINVSIQGSGERTAALDDAMGRAAEAGALVVVAAGNGIGNLDRSPEWPASIRAANTLTVTAVDLRDRLTGHRFGLRSVDLAAPAPDGMVCTTFPGTGSIDAASDDACTSRGGRYARFGQSSAAAAMVTGAALLLWGHPNYRDCTAEQVRALLLKHARTPDDEGTRAVLSPFGGVLDVRFLADVVHRDGRVVDLCSGALR